MQRSKKTSLWLGSMAMVALLAGVTARAADPAPATGHAKVTVKVVDADGKAVAGAKVTVGAPRAGRGKKAAGGDAGATSQPTTPTVAPMTGTTEADGTAVIKDVPDGSYAVMANLKGTGRGRAKLTVADGKDESVSITLAAAPGK